MTIVISFDFLFVKITVYETSVRKRSQQDIDNAELSLTPTGCVREVSTLELPEFCELPTPVDVQISCSVIVLRRKF